MINACNSDIRLINMTHIAEIQVINSSGYYLYEAITLHEQLDKAWVLQTSYLLVKASNKVKKKIVPSPNDPPHALSGHHSASSAPKKQA